MAAKHRLRCEKCGARLVRRPFGWECIICPKPNDGAPDAR
jgi:hypothetical protein